MVAVVFEHNKGSEVFMVLRVMPTQISFPTSILASPVNNILLHSIPSM